MIGTGSIEFNNIAVAAPGGAGIVNANQGLYLDGDTVQLGGPSPGDAPVTNQRFITFGGGDADSVMLSLIASNGNTWEFGYDGGTATDLLRYIAVGATITNYTWYDLSHVISTQSFVFTHEWGVNGNIGTHRLEISEELGITLVNNYPFGGFSQQEGNITFQYKEFGSGFDGVYIRSQDAITAAFYANGLPDNGANNLRIFGHPGANNFANLILGTEGENDLLIYNQGSSMGINWNASNIFQYQNLTGNVFVGVDDTTWTQLRGGIVTGQGALTGQAIWKMGTAIITPTPLTLETNQYIEIEVNGVLYKLLIAAP